MSILSDWLDLNKMNPAFQAGELCRIFGLTMASANGIISFTGGDGSPLANYVVGKIFDYNLDEIDPPKPEPVVVPAKVVPTPVVVAPKVVEPVVADVTPVDKKDGQ